MDDKRDSQEKLTTSKEQKIGNVLTEKEQALRLMADTAPVMIWISGTDKLCTWFNKPWLDFVGRPMEQELGNGWADNVHHEDFERCLQIYTSSFDARQPFSMEYRLKRNDGEYRWLLDNGTPQYDNKEFIGYIGSCVDITEQKETEQILRLNEERYRAIVEGSGEMLCRFRPDGNILFVNEAYARLGGTTVEALMSSNFWQRARHCGGSRRAS